MKFVPSLLAASICSAVFAASAAVPLVTDTIAKNAELMNADPAMQALLKEATSAEAQKWRFNTLSSLPASPPRRALKCAVRPKSPAASSRSGALRLKTS